MSKLNFNKKVVYHERLEDGSGYTGRTIAVLHVGDDRIVGISNCSNNDNFNKKRGFEISLGRALFALKVFNGDTTRNLTLPKSKGLVEIFNNTIGASILNVPEWMTAPTTNEVAVGE